MNEILILKSNQKSGNFYFDRKELICKGSGQICNMFLFAYLLPNKNFIEVVPLREIPTFQ